MGGGRDYIGLVRGVAGVVGLAWVALLGRSILIDFAWGEGGKVDIHTHNIWFFVAGVKSRNSSNRKGQHCIFHKSVCIAVPSESS